MAVKPKEGRAFKPVEYLSAEAKSKAIEEMSDRRMHSLLDYHEPKFNNAWKAQQELWSKLDDDGRRDAVFGMVMADGAIKIPMILKYFGITKEDFAPYRDIHEMACAALHFKIQRNQISIAFWREDQMDMKYFLGRQFAGQVQNPAHEETPSVDENSKAPIVIFAESAGLAPEKRDELEGLIQTAMQSGKVRKIK